MNGIRSDCVAVIVAFLLIGTAALGADTKAGKAPKVNNDGPRVGVMSITGPSAGTLRERGIAPVISLFGWQSETEFHTASGLRGNSSLILLVAGLDQGVAIPSASWLVGLRRANGWEFGIGPNASLAGLGLVLAYGKTRAFGELKIPLDFAVTLADRGLRLSLLSGFNTRS